MDAQQGPPDWAVHLPQGAALVHCRELDAVPRYADLAVIGQGRRNTVTPVRDGAERSCLGAWLRLLNVCPSDCPKVAIADLSSAQHKTLLSAGLDAVFPNDLSGDIVAQQFRALLRLYRKAQPCLELGSLSLYPGPARALWQGRDLRLTQREFMLLHNIALGQGRAVSPEELRRRVFDLRFDPETNLVAVHIYRLRGKLRDAGAEHILQTVQGRGYRLMVKTHGAERLF